MSRDQRRIVLVERDKQLMVRLFENRVMSLSQIGTEFFSTVKRQTFMSRLSKLAHYGFLDRRVVCSAEMGDFPIYSVKPKAFEVIKAQYPFQIVRDYCKSDSVEHDVELVNIRNRLRAFRSVASYYTENMLQTCSNFSGADSLAAFKRQNTDVAMGLWKNGRVTNVGLEFERSEKIFDRYTKKLFGYYSDSRTAVILYVCRNPAIQKVVARAEASVMGRNHPRCFYAQLEDILPPNEKCIFKNLKGNTITLD